MTQYGHINKRVPFLDHGLHLQLKKEKSQLYPRGKAHFVEPHKQTGAYGQWAFFGAALKNDLWETRKGREKFSNRSIYIGKEIG